MLAVVLTTVLGAAFVRVACGASLQAAMGAFLQYYEALWLVIVEGAEYQQLRKYFGAPRVPSSKKIREENSDEEAVAAEAPASELSSKQERRLASAMWMHAVALHLQLLNQQIYAEGFLREELQSVLAGAAGAGPPVTLLCTNRVTTICYLIFVHPAVVCLAALVAVARGNCGGKQDFGDVFEEKLLSPMRWFAHWTLRGKLRACAEGRSPVMPADGKLTRLASEGSYEEDVSTATPPSEASDLCNEEEVGCSS